MSFNRTQSAPVRAVYRALERRAARYTHAFISVADAMTAQAVAGGMAERERFTTIYSGMETDRFAPDAELRNRTRAEWGVGPADVVVGTIARLFRNKGYEEIIAAMPGMVREAGSLRFVWVGDGQDRPRYERELTRIGLRERVHMTGLVLPERIPALLAGFDILVHASKWEGLPRAIPQAMLMEVPVVSFDNDGAPEVVTPGVTGELVPFGDVPGLAAAVGRLADSADERQRLASAGRGRCLEMFDHREMVRQIEELYHRLIH
jgi:glycosyltransferase involved in cell wall biosynthesis